MLARVFMSNDLCPDGIQPYIAVGMIEMPVRVDQVRDGIGAKTGKSSGDLRTRYANTGIGRCRRGLAGRRLGYRLIDPCWPGYPR